MNLTDREKEIILAMAACDMNKTNAAAKLYFHRNTMAFHMDKIRKKTGLDPRRFYDLVKLLEMVNE